MRSCSRVAQQRWSRMFFCSSVKKLSMALLLPAAAMGSWFRFRSSLSVTAHRSSWTGEPGLLAIAAPVSSRTRTTSCCSMRSATPCDPTTLRQRRGPCQRATRCPNPGSSLCASNSAFARYTPTTSLVVIGLCQPPVVGLAGEREHPTRHRHREPCAGALLHPRDIS